MFNNIVRELEKIQRNGGTISVPVSMPLDEDGYLDRRCPSDACHAGFKVLMQDWKNKIGDAKAFCPICREEAGAMQWHTPEQRSYIRKVGMNHLRGTISQALSQ